MWQWMTMLSVPFSGFRLNSVLHVLNNHPKEFISHMMERFVQPNTWISKYIRQLSSGTYEPHGTSDRVCQVTITDDTFPHSTCRDFTNTHWPYKHLGAIIQVWLCTWKYLPLSYRNNPHFVLNKPEILVINETELVAGNINSYASPMEYFSNRRVGDLSSKTSQYSKPRDDNNTNKYKKVANKWIEVITHIMDIA